MLNNEAIWIGKHIPSLTLKSESIVLNFGSQNEKYNLENKYLLDYVINPIKKICHLRNLDLQTGANIHYSGNLYEDSFFNELKKVQFDCVLLCNVLEHVTDINELSNRIAQLIKPEGYIIFSGPYKYPLHFDPIDNGFRPEIDEINKLFPDFEYIKGEIVKDHTYSYYLFSNIKVLAFTFFRVITPFYKYKKWKQVVIPKLKWWNKNFKATCVIIKKTKKQ